MKIRLISFLFAVVSIIGGCSPKESIEPSYPFMGKWIVVGIYKNETNILTLDSEIEFNTEKSVFGFEHGGEGLVSLELNYIRNSDYTEVQLIPWRLVSDNVITLDDEYQLTISKLNSNEFNFEMLDKNNGEKLEIRSVRTLNVEQPSAGNADFTRFISIGDSFTAGYADGGLYREGQLNSFPAILAKQFRNVGGGTFTQPLFTEAQRNGSGYLRLTGFDAAGNPLLSPVTDYLAIRGTGSNNKLLYTKYENPIQNLGIPGMKLENINMPGYGFQSTPGFNPYLERLIPDSQPNPYLYSYVNLVETSNPTFFTLWLGANDVLSYATSGGTIPITQLTMFESKLSALIAILTKSGAKGMVINIPDITTMPHFTNKTTTALIQTGTSLGLNLYITQSNGVVRVATIEDYVLPTTTAGTPENVGGAIMPRGFNPLSPLRNNEVLDKDEIIIAKQATNQFNQIIAGKATANIGIVDISAFFNSVKTGLNVNGFNYSSTFITGKVFSLDKIHPTPRGNALIANEIIKAINNKHNAKIHLADETRYNAVKNP
ncbi:hypothetical protein I0P70_09085 [Pontibacter sp. FD36]|uniref:SGNH/GDSL hydrolase family protein n=1 Tax=Pontibacter sp. FD36 TaxID=2789860 RepID=UPI0018AA250D|nr:SGNH/GDSL hydrolase family protein [Pontibacter sp. FD36]MBF8963398.1 hypothetical protein [Pontibacter sp. FD36]